MKTNIQKVRKINETFMVNVYPSLINNGLFTNDTIIEMFYDCINKNLENLAIERLELDNAIQESKFILKAIEEAKNCGK